MQIIYCGEHPQLVSPEWDGPAVRNGEPVDVPARIAKELIAREDFVKYEAEPASQPVEKTSSKSS